MDGDVFTRKVRRIWRRLADAISSQSEPTVCAHLLEAALAADLRKSGGLAALPLAPDDPDDRPSEQRVAGALQERWQAEVVERIAPSLVGRGVFETYDDVQTFVARVNAIARFDVLAGAALRHPDGKGVRRPAMRRRDADAIWSESAPLGPRA